MSRMGMMFRVLCTFGDRKRDKGLVEPEDVLALKDIPYGKEGKYQLLDVYLPKNTKGPLPVIVSVHGGGYVYGTKKVYIHYGMFLAQQGFAVVNFNYTLAPKKRFPSQLEEINMVMEWIVKNAEKYQIDPKQICMVGDSAGAQLASHYCTIYSNPEFAKLFSFQVPEGCRICATALNCGMYDISEDGAELFAQIKAAGGPDTRPLCDDYLGRNFPLSDDQLKVLKYITKDFPPSYVMTSQYDFLKEAAKPMYDLLQERGVRSEYHLYGTEEQTYMGHVFHVNMNLEEAKECDRDTCRFFRECLEDASRETKTQQAE